MHEEVAKMRENVATTIKNVAGIREKVDKITSNAWISTQTARSSCQHYEKVFKMRQKVAKIRSNA